jgi:hypothetical protein
VKVQSYLWRSSHASVIAGSKHTDHVAKVADRPLISSIERRSSITKSEPALPRQPGVSLHVDQAHRMNLNVLQRQRFTSFTSSTILIYHSH